MAALQHTVPSLPGRIESLIPSYMANVRRPEFIGWVCGQPVRLNDGTKLPVSVSGFHRVSDLGIVIKAIDLPGRYKSI